MTIDVVVVNALRDTCNLKIILVFDANTLSIFKDGTSPLPHTPPPPHPQKKTFYHTAIS